MEYAGYVSPDSFIDYEALSGKLAEKVYGIGTKRTAEKEALDQSARDLEKIVNDPSIVGKNETATKMFLDAAYDAKNQIWNWNKELKAGRLDPRQYKQNMMSLQENWGTLASSAKTFDERYQEIMKRQQEGVASNYELELLNRFGQMADIQNTKIKVSNDGRLYSSKVDPATGAPVGELMDIRSMNLPQNIQMDKIDVGSTVEGLTEGWDPWTTFKDLGRGGELNIEDIRENKEFGKMKASVAEAVAPNSNPRAQVSVLVDNGVITKPYYYMNDAEYNQMRQELIDDAKQIKRTAGQKDELSEDEIKQIDQSLIKIEKDKSGIINPVLNEDQQKAAKERVMRDVEIRMERKITGSPKQQWSTSTRVTDGDGKTDPKQEALAGYLATLDAFGFDREAARSGKAVKSGQSDFGGLSKNYSYQYKNGKIYVYNKGDFDPSTGQPVKNGDKQTPASPVAVASEPNDLAQYAIGGDASEATIRYNDARNQYRGGAKTTSGAGDDLFKK